MPAVPTVMAVPAGTRTVVSHLRPLRPGGGRRVRDQGQLAEGARQVKTHGRYVPVRAEVVTVPDFSVHSDGTETIEWLGHAPRAPQTVYVVHGEPASAQALAGRIASELGWTAVVPTPGERVLLD